MQQLDYETLLALHVFLVRDLMGEETYGVAGEGLLRSALARPRQAEKYEDADGLRQATYLFQGLLMNHGFVQGNKRTAYLALEWFLRENALGVIVADDQDVIDMCLAPVEERWSVDAIDEWLRVHVSGPQGADTR